MFETCLRTMVGVWREASSSVAHKVADLHKGWTEALAIGTGSKSTRTVTILSHPIPDLILLAAGWLKQENLLDKTAMEFSNSVRPLGFGDWYKVGRLLKREWEWLALFPTSSFPRYFSLARTFGVAALWIYLSHLPKLSLHFSIPPPVCFRCLMQALCLWQQLLLRFSMDLRDLLCFFCAAMLAHHKSSPRALRVNCSGATDALKRIESPAFLISVNAMATLNCTGWMDRQIRKCHFLPKSAHSICHR